MGALVGETPACFPSPGSPGDLKAGSLGELIAPLGPGLSSTCHLCADSRRETGQHNRGVTDGDKVPPRPAKNKRQL